MENPFVICPECNGVGFFVRKKIEQFCCGFNNEDGSCCNKTIPILTNENEQCSKCKSMGMLVVVKLSTN